MADSSPEGIKNDCQWCSLINTKNVHSLVWDSTLVHRVANVGFP